MRADNANPGGVLRCHLAEAGMAYLRTSTGLADGFGVEVAYALLRNAPQ